MKNWSDLLQDKQLFRISLTYYVGALGECSDDDLEECFGEAAPAVVETAYEMAPIFFPLKNDIEVEKLSEAEVNKLIVDIESARNEIKKKMLKGEWE